MKKMLIIIISILTLIDNCNCKNIVVTQGTPILNLNNIQFNVSWENSWRDSVNHDAVWLFAKYKINGDTVWKNCTLNTTGHFLPVASEHYQPGDNKGIYIYLAQNGGGTNTWNSCSLSWNYNSDNLQNLNNVTVHVFGIEMVYIPQGAFYAGDNSVTSVGRFKNNSNLPILIDNSSFTISTSISASGYDDQNIVSGINLTSSYPNYPTGFKSYYIMKYEITQSEYVNFLNYSINSYLYKKNHCFYCNSTVSQIVSYRDSVNYAIVMSSDIDHTCSTTKPGYACNLINWDDGCCFADWACLRPMTELEYEKACRGNANYISGEFAWGTPDICNNVLSDSNGIFGNVCNGLNSYGNCHWSYVDHLYCTIPVGLYELIGLNLSRIYKGSSYYGVMELSGSLWEPVVSLGNSYGRDFVGTTGNGIEIADTTDHSDGFPLNWCYYKINNTYIQAGTGFRGGGFCIGNYSHKLSVSDRTCASMVSKKRHESYGFRCVRSVP